MPDRLLNPERLNNLNHHLDEAQKALQRHNRAPALTIQGSTNKLVIYETTQAMKSHTHLTDIRTGAKTPDDHRLVIDGKLPGAIQSYLKENPEIKQITFAFGGSKSSRAAVQELAKQFLAQDYAVKAELSQGKSWTSDLSRAMQQSTEKVTTHIPSIEAMGR